MQAPAAGEEGGTPPCEKPVLPWRLEPCVQFPCPAQKENDRICHTGILKMETTGAWRVARGACQWRGQKSQGSPPPWLPPSSPPGATPRGPEVTSLQRAAVQGPHRLHQRVKAGDSR